MPTFQRLVVCLDGTWNRQDSSTNVLHQYNLVCDGMLPGTDVFQNKYYHLGVGTGVLDSISGGSFGFGLEANVRDAYNWLVQNVREYDDHPKFDEIYIFGFSRGAYTARSVVGFIAQCGLLRRGAPVTVEQLWRDYCVLGRQKEERTSIWDKILGKDVGIVRSYTDLQRATSLTEDEKLLLHWSRRVPIKYLGIYDTVGAIGWDALAIPGLTSRLALHNNIRPTTLIQKCRHALAIDEQRSNFKHTPFVAYLEEDAEELEREAGPAARTIAQNRAMWKRKIEQRWFVGSHSNVGGGYDSNRLAQRPLEWIMEGALEQGLACERLPQAEIQSAKEVSARDSYGEFAPPLWETVIRNKREYRVIGPAAKLSARAKRSGNGFALETINETIDDSVFAYWKDSARPVSPNLECYLKRNKRELPAGARPARHCWPRATHFAYTAVVVWTVLAVFGIYALDSVGGFTEHGLPIWFVYTAALFLPLIDWGESKVAFEYAVGAAGPRARAFLDAVYWTRTLGFVLFVFGAIYGICACFASGTQHHWPVSLAFLRRYGAIPLVAAIAALITTKFCSQRAWAALFTGPVVVGLVGSLLFAIGAGANALFPGFVVETFWDSGPVYLPGCLLLLQLGGIYVWRSLVWVGEPLAQANLGSITDLQKCATPSSVIKCLSRWRDLLANTKQPDDAPNGAPAVHVREILRHALWRDIIGFIPVYTAFLLYALKFATLVHFEDWAALISWLPFDGLAETIRPKVVPVMGFWWVLPVLAAVTDYAEDICHLRYCRLYEQDPSRVAPSAGLAMFSFLMTSVKDLAFTAAAVIAILSVLAGTHASLSQVADWRAKFAIVLTGVGVVAVALLSIAFGAGIVRKRRMREVTDSPAGPAGLAPRESLRKSAAAD
jgi:uncharacterized protein (DUF2235 family)